MGFRHFIEECGQGGFVPLRDAQGLPSDRGGSCGLQRVGLEALHNPRMGGHWFHFSIDYQCRWSRPTGRITQEDQDPRAV